LRSSAERNASEIAEEKPFEKINGVGIYSKSASLLTQVIENDAATRVLRARDEHQERPKRPPGLRPLKNFAASASGAAMIIDFSTILAGR